MCSSGPSKACSRTSRPTELQAQWRVSRHRLRDRAFWALAYSTAARADELLQLNVEQLDLPNW
jgi:integrase